MSKLAFGNVVLIPYLHGVHKYQIYWAVLDNGQVNYISAVPY